MTDLWISGGRTSAQSAGASGDYDSTNGLMTPPASQSPPSSQERSQLAPIQNIALEQDESGDSAAAQPNNPHGKRSRTDSIINHRRHQPAQDNVALSTIESPNPRQRKNVRQAHHSRRVPAEDAENDNSMLESSRRQRSSTKKSASQPVTYVAPIPGVGLSPYKSVLSQTAIDQSRYPITHFHRTRYSSAEPGNGNAVVFSPAKVRARQAHIFAAANGDSDSSGGGSAQDSSTASESINSGVNISVSLTQSEVDHASTTTTAGTKSRSKKTTSSSSTTRRNTKASASTAAAAALSGPGNVSTQFKKLSRRSTFGRSHSWASFSTPPPARGMRVTKDIAQPVSPSDDPLLLYASRCAEWDYGTASPSFSRSRVLRDVTVADWAVAKAEAGTMTERERVDAGMGTMPEENEDEQQMEAGIEADAPPAPFWQQEYNDREDDIANTPAPAQSFLRTQSMFEPLNFGPNELEAGGFDEPDWEPGHAYAEDGRGNESSGDDDDVGEPGNFDSSAAANVFQSTPARRPQASLGGSFDTDEQGSTDGDDSSALVMAQEAGVGSAEQDVADDVSGSPVLEVDTDVTREAQASNSDPSYVHTVDSSHGPDHSNADDYSDEREASAEPDTDSELDEEKEVELEQSLRSDERSVEKSGEVDQSVTSPSHDDDEVDGSGRASDHPASDASQSQSVGAETETEAALSAVASAGPDGSNSQSQLYGDRTDESGGSLQAPASFSLSQANTNESQEDSGPGQDDDEDAMSIAEVEQSLFVSPIGSSDFDAESGSSSSEAGEDEEDDHPDMSISRDVADEQDAEEADVSMRSQARVDEEQQDSEAESSDGDKDSILSDNEHASRAATESPRRNSLPNALPDASAFLAFDPEPASAERDADTSMTSFHERDADAETSLRSFQRANSSASLLLMKSSEHPVIQISSLDPRAAAKAAAILKLHYQYVEEGFSHEEVDAAELKKYGLSVRDIRGLSVIPDVSDLPNVLADEELRELERQRSRQARAQRRISLSLRSPAAKDAASVAKGANFSGSSDADGGSPSSPLTTPQKRPMRTQSTPGASLGAPTPKLPGAWVWTPANARPVARPSMKGKGKATPEAPRTWSPIMSSVGGGSRRRTPRLEPDPLVWELAEWTALDRVFRKQIREDAVRLLEETETRGAADVAQQLRGSSVSAKALSSLRIEPASDAVTKRKIKAHCLAVLDADVEKVFTTFVRKHDVQDSQLNGVWSSHRFATRIAALQRRYLERVEKHYACKDADQSQLELVSIAQAELVEMHGPLSEANKSAEREGVLRLNAAELSVDAQSGGIEGGIGSDRSLRVLQSEDSMDFSLGGAMLANAGPRSAEQDQGQGALHSTPVRGLTGGSGPAFRAGESATSTTARSNKDLRRAVLKRTFGPSSNGTELTATTGHLSESHAPPLASKRIVDGSENGTTGLTLAYHSTPKQLSRTADPIEEQQLTPAQRLRSRLEASRR